MSRKLRRWGKRRGQFVDVHEYINYKQGVWHDISKWYFRAWVAYLFVEVVLLCVGLFTNNEIVKTTATIMCIISWLIIIGYAFVSSKDTKWNIKLSLFDMRMYESFIDQGEYFDYVTNSILAVSAEEKVKYLTVVSALERIENTRKIYGEFYLKPNTYYLTVTRGNYALADSLINDEIDKVRAAHIKRVARSEEQLKNLKKQLRKEK